MGAHARQDVRPPGFVRWALGRLLPRRDRTHVLLEMDDLYARRVRRVGRMRASLWYAWRLAGFPLRVATARFGAGAMGLSSGAWSTLRDLRHAVRALRRRPGYALANILTLAVGIGGIATVYAVANWVLLRPVPGLADPATLVTIQLELGGPNHLAYPISEPDRRTLAERSTSLQAVVGSHEVDVNASLEEGIPPRRISGAVVSPGYFRVLGVRALVGRLPDGTDAEADPAVVVVSRDLWRDVWAASPDVLGATIRIDGRPFTVVGVTPAGFHGAELPGQVRSGAQRPSEVRLWFPPQALSLLDPGYGPDALHERGTRVWTGLVGRLAPGGTPARVAQEGDSTMAHVRELYREHSYYARFVYRAYAGVGLSPRVRGPVRRTLTLLAAAAALLLLLALANVTNLTLTHAVARNGEAAVHAALGAGRARIGRRILAEQALLGIAGGGAGVLLSAVVIRAFSAFSLSDLGASLEGIHLDPRVVAFTLLGALAVTLLAGLVPAAAAGAGDLLAALSGYRQGSRRTHRAQSGLVVAQVALSTLLLVGAGLFLRTVINLRDADPGFAPDRVLRFSIDPGLQQGLDSAGIRDVMSRVDARLTGTTGVVAAGFASPTPVRNTWLTFAVEPHEGTPEDKYVVGAQLQVTPGFLDAMGVRFLAGRGFDLDAPEGAPRDRAAAETVSRTPAEVVMSRKLAREVWPDLSPAEVVGRTLYRPSWPRDATPTPMRVVGVVEDVRLMGVTQEPPPVIFLPWRFGTSSGEDITGWVRVRGRPEDMATAVRVAVSAADPSLPVYDARPVRAAMDDLVAAVLVITRLALGLALVGLLLAGVGLQGVLGYAVTQRSREIGVRVALGAAPLDLVGRLMRRGLLLTALGALVGGVAAVGLTRVIASRLFGVAPLDPVTWGAGVVLLLVTATLATWSPARRSLHVSPREALNAE